MRAVVSAKAQPLQAAGHCAPCAHGCPQANKAADIALEEYMDLLQEGGSGTTDQMRVSSSC